MATPKLVTSVPLTDARKCLRSNEQHLDAHASSIYQLERLYPLSGIKTFSPSNSDLGATLDTVPNELLHAVLSHLDLASFMSFRCVNKRAMEVADALLIYKKVGATRLYVIVHRELTPTLRRFSSTTRPRLQCAKRWL
jgi:hypothetical protein